MSVSDFKHVVETLDYPRDLYRITSKGKCSISPPWPSVQKEDFVTAKYYIEVCEFAVGRKCKPLKECASTDRSFGRSCSKEKCSYKIHLSRYSGDDELLCRVVDHDCDVPEGSKEMMRYMAKNDVSHTMGKSLAYAIVCRAFQINPDWINDGTKHAKCKAQILKDYWFPIAEWRIKKAVSRKFKPIVEPCGNSLTCETSPYCAKFTILP